MLTENEALLLGALLVVGIGFIFIFLLNELVKLKDGRGPDDTEEQ